MKRLFIAVVFVVSVCLARSAHAYTFEGSDWLFNLHGTLTTPLGSDPVNVDNEPLTITQSSVTDVVIPLTISGIPVNVPGTVSGTHLSAHVVDPTHYDAGSNIWVRDLTVHLEGDATGITPLVVGAYGDRVYEVTGNPSPTSYITAKLYLNDAVYIGDAVISINDWQLLRPVPEPSGLLVLGAGLASLVYKRRRRAS